MVLYRCTCGCNRTYDPDAHEIRWSADDGVMRGSPDCPLSKVEIDLSKLEKVS